MTDRQDRQTDGRTDGQTEFSSQYRVFCSTCSAVKTSEMVGMEILEKLKEQEFVNTESLVIKMCFKFFFKLVVSMTSPNANSVLYSLSFIVSK